MNTRTDAEQFVTHCIENSGVTDASEYDVDTIVDQLNEVAKTRYDFNDVDHDTFWMIVQDNEI
jgi:hypothetical protein